MGNPRAYSTERVPSPALTDRRFHALFLCALVALTAGLYAPTLDDEWHLDDLAQLTPTVRELSPHVAKEHYRGIVVLWLWTMDYAIGGEDTTSFHVTNAVVHFATSASLYWLAWLLAPAGRSRRLAAAAAAGIFCVHPLATQSIAYLTQRSTSLAALFFLISVASWITYRRTTGIRAWVALAASLGALAIGLHTKHVVILVPAAILTYEALFPVAHRRRALVWLVPLVLLSVWRLIDFAPRLEGRARFQDDEASWSMPPISRTEYVLSQPRSIATYLRLLLWPRGQNLDPDLAPVPSASAPGFLVPASILALLAVAGWRVRRARPAATFGVALFFLTLLPTSSLIPSADLLFELRAYLPMAGLCLALVPLVGAAHRRHAQRTWIAVTAVIAMLSVACSRRLAVWDTELSLWSDVVAKSPGKARPHVNLGLALQNAGRLEEAEAHYGRSLEIRPDYPFALNNLGNVVRSLGRPAEAEALFHRAMAVRPGYVGPRINLGNLALDRGDLSAAEAWYRAALEAGPEAAEARYNLAKVLERRGDWAEAVVEYERVVQARPQDTVFLNDLGCARLSSGDAAGAERDLRRVVARRPDWGVGWYNLGLALDALGRADEARRAYEQALEVTPGLAPAQKQLER